MIHPLLEHPSAPDFLREFHEEHLSEFAFLSRSVGAALHEPGMEWPNIESLEIRILRHAEAMQAGGDAAITCAREALAGEDPDELTAGIHTIAFLGDSASRR